MQKMGLISGPAAPLEPEMWTKWNTPDKDLTEKVGPGEVSKAVPWSVLTPVQKDFQRTKMAIHAAMITRMDAEIGKVLDQVKAMGAERDTIVLFMSDNGASSEQLIRGDGHDSTAAPGSMMTHLGLGPGWSSNANAPFRLHKSWVNEGGIASPLIVSWPNGNLDANKLRHEPCHFVDIVPTLVELAGGRSHRRPELRLWPVEASRLPCIKTERPRMSTFTSITTTIGHSARRLEAGCDRRKGRVGAV